MPRFPFAAAALAATLALPAFAQTHSHSRDGHSGSRTPGAYQGGRHSGGGHYSGGHYSGGRYGSYRYYSRPSYGYRFYGGWPLLGWPAYSYVYPAPLFGYAFEPPYYAPPPYPVYEDEPPPPPVQRDYREPYAQLSPDVQPAPRAAPAERAPAFDRITLSATELFEFDKAVLRMPQPKLDEIARALIDNPSVGNVTITGYTDRLGADEYNVKLSQRRADAVKRYLVGKGVAASRLTSIGRGKANPVVQCDDEDRAALIRCLEPNRRVEVERITIERAVAQPLR